MVTKNSGRADQILDRHGGAIEAGDFRSLPFEKKYFSFRPNPRKDLLPLEDRISIRITFNGRNLGSALLDDDGIVTRGSDCGWDVDFDTHPRTSLRWTQIGGRCFW